MTTWDALMTTHDEAGGNWVTLPGNGWGALGAYIAGPGHARAVPHQYGPVRVTCIVNDVEKTWFEPITDREIQEQEHDVASYLASYDIPLRRRASRSRCGCRQG